MDAAVCAGRLVELYDAGPLPARELPDTTLVPWQSSGWNDARNVRMLLELMVQRGEVAVAGSSRAWPAASGWCARCPARLPV